VRALVPVLVRVPAAAVQDAVRRIRTRREKLTSSFVEKYQKTQNLQTKICIFCVFY